MTARVALEERAGGAFQLCAAIQMGVAQNEMSRAAANYAERSTS